MTSAGTSLEIPATRKNLETSCDEERFSVESLTVGDSIMSRMIKHLYLRRGMFAAFNAAIFFALVQSLVKCVATTVNPFQVVVTMMPIVFTTSFILIIFKGIRPPREVKHYMWLLPSGLAIAFMNATNVLALRYIGLADAITIIQLSVIFVGFLSWIILKEPPRVLDFIFAAMALGGVVFATRPSFIFGQNESDSHVDSYDPLRGMTFALVSAMLIALANVVVRRQCTLGIHPYVSSVANALMSTLINLIVCVATQHWTCPTRMVLLTLLAAGLSYAIAQISLYIAFSLESATVVAIILTAQIVIAFFWQFIFFKLSPLWTSALGGGLVMAACIGSMVTRNKSLRNTQADRDSSMS